MLQPLPRLADSVVYSRPNTAASVVQSDIQDIDRLAAGLPGWDIEYSQLSGGAFQGSISLLSLGSIRIIRVMANQVLLARGRAPAGAISFIVAGNNPDAAGKWAGIDFERNDIVMLDAEAEIDLHAPESFVQLIFSVSAEVWRSMDGPRVVSPAAAAGRDARILTADAAGIELLRTDSERRLAAELPYPDVRRHPAIQRFTGHDLLGQLQQLTQSAQDKVCMAAGPANRRMAVKRADDYLRAHLEEPITLNDLRNAANVGTRTLEYAFREQYGLTPVAYLKHLRLHRLRRDLCVQHSHPKTITTLAIRWGFWHMSQLTADYKRLFSETPSQTLQRSRQRRPDDFASGPTGDQRRYADAAH
jgi:AraC family ethanolamine operon transcriptional activator